MKWFNGKYSSKEDLTKEYKKLARKWHPDVCKDRHAVEVMQQINAEYDEIFSNIQLGITGYDADEIKKSYDEAKSMREMVFIYMRKDKLNEGKWFGMTKYGKVISDDSNEWKSFKGGFALVGLKISRTLKPDYGMFWTSTDRWHHELLDEHVKKLNAKIEVPTYADLYFAMNNDVMNSDSTDISIKDSKISNAEISKYVTMYRVKNKYIGEAWIMRDYHKIHAFMKVNGIVMRCNVPILASSDTEVIEIVDSEDFGMKAFQDCSIEEFRQYHDTVFSKYHGTMDCQKIRSNQDLYFIDDPMVAYFARKGLVEFYQSKRNYQLRYGIFNMDKLLENIHMLTIDDAEHIQDYLDELNTSFNDHVKGMIRKGKIKVII